VPPMPLFRAPCLIAIIVISLLSAHATAETVGVVSNVLVLTDKSEDVSSIEAWTASVIKPGMSDQDKAIAAFWTVVKHRHHDSAPLEYASLDSANVRDAIKICNVYGYCTADSAQTAVMQLWRHLGFEARGWTVNRWGCAPEVKYGGAWHMLDPGQICYYLKPDGTIAGVEELVAGVKNWHAAHPGIQGDVPKIKAFFKTDGINNGPEILRTCPTMNERGSFTLDYFGWYTSMLVYDGSKNTPFRFEDAYTQGYRANIQLRPGMRLTRNWSNTGLHVNLDGNGKVPEALNATIGKGVFAYQAKLGDLANGRVGNGTFDWQVPLSPTSFASAALTQENIDCSDGIRAKDPGKAASFVLRVPSSYVYLTGSATIDLTLAAGGVARAEVSANNGIDWKDVGAAGPSGPWIIDLSPHVLRRYDYRLRITLSGNGTALRAIAIHHDIQHSQRPLPALLAGDNRILFHAGAPEGTVSMEGAGPKFAGKGLTVDDLHIQFEHIKRDELEKSGVVIPEGKGASVTYPVEVPGDLVRLRFGCNYRARGQGDSWAYQVSFDGGTTFTDVDHAAGPTHQDGKFIVYSDIPAHTRKALVRFTAVGSPMLFRARVDADYRESSGGFAPVQVTYAWRENGQDKSDVHVAKAADEHWTIACAGKPEMRSIVLELAP
jgi:hypothetical protein